MNTIRHEVWINADKDTVFNALTTQAGLDGWWGKAVSAEPKVGHVVEFDHGHGELIKMRITELVPNHRLVWKCISDHADAGYPGSEWLGHELRFELAPATDDPSSGRLRELLFDKESDEHITVLCFEQEGWKHDDRWHAFCNSAWGATLDGGLRTFCEDGNRSADLSST